MKLSIIISERNDPFGTLITIRSLMEDLKSCDFNAEIIVVDNSDDKEKLKTFKDIASGFIHRKEIKLLEQSYQCLFNARELGVNNSTGKYIMVVDSHCLMYYETIKQMIERYESTPNIGMLFGSMCYSRAHEVDAFVDRDVKSFRPIRLCASKHDLTFFKIPLRSMPYIISRSIWDEMKGYEPLSSKRLVWGGGDFLISLKPLILGYDNYVLTTAGVIHLGPFNDKGFFTDTFIHDSGGPHRYVGMLTAAYVIGGESLLERRFEILQTRYKGDLNRLKFLALENGAEFRRWFKTVQKRDYDDICREFYGLQGDVDERRYIDRNILPKPKKFSVVDKCSVEPKKPDKKLPWKSRAGIDRSNLKQSGVAK